MKGAPALVLDFDGVICDSIDECFASSWIAFHTLYRKEAPSRVPAACRREFARLRPFVRSGEDFLLIQQAIDQGGSPESQAEFDLLARAAGPATLQRFRELLQAARTRMRAKDREAWLALNRIYPHVLVSLARMPWDAPLYVLSTKNTSLIAEILSSNGIGVPAERIRFSSSDQKLPAVERLRVESGRARAIFVDDQRDHFAGDAGAPGAVDPYLASWGYVREEWLRVPLLVPVLTPDGFLSLIEREFRD